jgi:hypothetical protein
MNSKHNKGEFAVLLLERAMMLPTSDKRSTIGGDCQPKLTPELQA